MGEKEKIYVQEAFDTNWIAPLGPNVDIFEKQLASYTSAVDAVSLSSGTAALHLALLSLGVSCGEVVFCQSLTFGASAFPIRYVGAEPVFIDSEPDTWNMDPELLKQAVKETLEAGKKPAAIVVVHLYGMPAKMQAIVEIANAYGIPVIEDAAEALGSRYFDKACGGLADVGILSFNGNKIITTSGGGALLSNHPDVIAKVRHWSAQSKEPAPYYLHKEIGFNYRMSNICAGIGRGQMEVLENRVQTRRAHFNAYRQLLNDVPLLTFLDEPDGCFSNRWLTTVLFDKSLGNDIADVVRLRLEKQQIESRPLWKPLHQQPVFENCKAYVNGVSDDLFARGLCLPSGSAMNQEVLVQVTHTIRSCMI